MKEFRCVCIGDSITYGYQLDPQQRWTNLLSSDLNIEVLNAGINGDTTAGMLARFQQDVIDQQPSFTIITGATNDLWFGLRDEAIISNLYAMSRQAQFKDILPIIGITTPCFKFDESNFLYEDYVECIRSFRNTLIKFCQERDLEYIDFAKHFTSDHVMEDQLHPNADGHRVMMENAKEVIKSLLK
jgi:lysophospholipase L1-like esterase